MTTELPLTASDMGDSLIVIRSILETSAHLLSGDESDVELSSNLSLLALNKIINLEKKINFHKTNPANHAGVVHQTDVSFRIHSSHRNTSIGGTIRELRKSQQLTQKQLAESIGVTADAVTQWELGITEPSWKYILPLANALYCDLLWLLTRNNPENNQ